MTPASTTPRQRALYALLACGLGLALILLFLALSPRPSSLTRRDVRAFETDEPPVSRHP